MVDHFLFGFVEKIIFAFSRDNLKRFVADHFGNLVGENTGAVDDVFCLDNAGSGGQEEHIVLVFDVEYTAVSLDPCAVHNGVFRGGDGKLIRADNAGGRRPESTDGFFADVRLHFTKLFLTDDFHVGNAVVEASFEKRFEGLHIVPRIGYDKRADIFVGDGKLVAVIRHQGRALHVEFRFERAVFGVKACMNDCAVGL